MSLVKPPLPPRRKIPPLPPSVTDTVLEEIKQNGIASRIASLKLDQVSRAAQPPPIPDRKELREPESAGQDRTRPLGGTVEQEQHGLGLRPPPIPPKWTRPSPEQLARALARPPPPPPIKRSATYQAQPRNTGVLLSQKTSRLPTPPPDPEPHYESVLEDENSGQNFCLECRNFSKVDAHAALFPRHSVNSLDSLAYDLTEPFVSEIEKARAIFTWLHHNIAYDTKSFFSGDLQASTPGSTLSTGLAVCDGYSGLFKHLAETVGIQVHKVTGHGKGVGYEATSPDQPVPQYTSGHAWNCALLDNSWHLIDACWGAGALNGSTYQKRFAPMWFTSAPTEFARTHFPEDASYQLLSPEEGGPVSWEDYIMEPARPVVFVDFYQLDLWPTTLQPPWKYIEGNTRITFRVSKRCEHMSTAEADNFVFMVSFGKERVPLELDGQGGWSANIFVPKDAGEISLFHVTTVDGQDAKGIGIRALKNALGRRAMTFGGLARWISV